MTQTITTTVPHNRAPGKVVHITAGTPDWEPTREEMQQISDLFVTALNDPSGGVVTTRTGITVTIVDAVDGTITPLPSDPAV